jgi:hypothetical protein
MNAFIQLPQQREVEVHGVLEPQPCRLDPRHRQQLSRVQAPAVVAEVGDLVAAAEAGAPTRSSAAVPRTAGKSTRSPQAWLTS